jgi:hypothetical protein
MRIRTISATVGALLAATVLSASDDAFMGTWKLNEAKSNIGKGAPKVMTVVYEAAGDRLAREVRRQGLFRQRQSLGLALVFEG